MLELKLETYRKSVDIPQHFREVFPWPLVFYTMNHESYFLNSYVIVDFPNSQIRYAKTLFPENVKAVKEYDETLLNKFPHTTFDMGNGTFMSFTYTIFQQASGTRRIDFDNGKMWLISGKDLPHEDWPTLGEICDEPCKDENGDIYLAFVRDKKTTAYYKCSPDMTKMEKVFENFNEAGRSNSVLDAGSFPAKPPHHVTLYKNNLLSTGYNERYLKIWKDGKQVKPQSASVSYQKQTASRGEPTGAVITDGTVSETIRQDLRNRKLEPLKNKPLVRELAAEQFDKWWKNEMVFHYLLRDNGYSLVCENGQVIKYNLETKEMNTYNTKFNPSHIEIDSKTDSLYVMSNNISFFNNRFFYISSSYIDKMDLNGNIIWTYTDENLWRCTTHKFFEFSGRKFLVTFGHPNRLVFLEDLGDKAVPYYYHDMYKKVLPDEHRGEFLNVLYNPPMEDHQRYQAMQPSTDGKYIVTFSQEHVVFFDFEQRKIVYEMPYDLEEGFFQHSHHSCFLK